MHLGNGAITPECAAITYSAAAAGLSVSAAALKRSGLGAGKLQMAAVLGCAVFVGQAINLPLGPYFSGHLIGGVFLAWALGPALAAWTMAVVLATQAAVLGDGGVLALGANIVNMALIPAGLVAIWSRVSFEKTQAAQLISLITVGMIATLLAAMLIVGETALFRPADGLATWIRFGQGMLTNHIAIGLIEGPATILLAGIYVVARPRWPVFRASCISLAVVALIAASVVQIGSSLPDGYEAAAQASGLERLLR